MNNKLRCIHRHTIEEHPHCFATGKVKMSEKEYLKQTNNPWYTYPGYRIGYLDIEATNLNADWGYMLSWAIKPKGSNNVDFGVIKQKDILAFDFDKQLTEDLISAMQKYNILVTYYGTGFDIPYIRSRAMYHGLDFFNYGDIFHFDLYYTVKSKMKLSRNSLDKATTFLGIEGKTHIEPDLWRRATLGDPKALDYVLEHNVADVEILELLHDRLDFTRKWIRKSI